MNDQTTLISHFHAFKAFLDDPDGDFDLWIKRYPRTHHALKIGDPLSFDLPKEPENDPDEVTFPIKLTECVHGSKFTEDDRFGELVDEGYDEKFMEQFRYLIYELECEVELRKDGDVYITHVAGQEMDPPLKNK